MRKTVISDASCFIILEKIGHFELLNEVFYEVVTTPDIAREYGASLPNWVRIQKPKNTDKVDELSRRMGKGESGAIALALELDDCSLILDDQKARKIAEGLGIDVTGTIGVIVRAKLKGDYPIYQAVSDENETDQFPFLR